MEVSRVKDPFFERLGDRAGGAMAFCVTRHPLAIRVVLHLCKSFHVVAQRIAWDMMTVEDLPGEVLVSRNEIGGSGE